nr:MAG TPA: hypothetical protein [Caudoviricetes sp.]
MTMTDEMITKHSEELQSEAEAQKTGGGLYMSTIK